jgi:hypothetical protein
MSAMRYPCKPSTASTMSSLPERLSTSASAMRHTHPATHYNCREVLYHVDHQGRYAVQSCEVRPPSRQSPTRQPPSRQRLQESDDCPMLQPIERASLNRSRSTSRRAIIVVQSREGLRLDRPQVKGVLANSQKPAAPPPAPRPQRLPTPELSDLDDDEPFCHCDVEKKCDSRRGCLRKNHPRALV